MDMGISSFQDYPPRIVIQLGNEKPELWSVCLVGLTEEVAFSATSAIQVRK